MVQIIRKNKPRNAHVHKKWKWIKRVVVVVLRVEIKSE